jgi:dynactin complex subunit
MASDLKVGDPVDVPGDMYGIVKFIGNVRGKTGRFVGVELDSEFAAKGKNDGDVDGYVRASMDDEAFRY